MNVRNIVRSGCLLAAVVVTPIVSLGAGRQTCTSGRVTEESYKWNFPKEASAALKDVRAEAAEVATEADLLREFARNQSPDWEAHASELNVIKDEVNDMGTKICRLEAIRTTALPWQQDAIDRAALLTREMANNTEQAIHYLNGNHERLWMSTYRNYTTNLYNESERLAQSIGDLEKLAKLRQEEKDLSTTLTSKAGS